MSRSYDAFDWYWTVGSDATQVFSSKLVAYVPVTDPTYQAFLADGNRPAVTDDAGTLGSLLAQNTLRPTDPALLDGYLNSQANGVLVQVPFKLIFDLRNDVNVLQGKAPFTVAQARAYVKSKL